MTIISAVTDIETGMNYLAVEKALESLGYTNSGFVNNRREKLKIVKFINRRTDLYRQVNITHNWVEGKVPGVMVTGVVTNVELKSADRGFAV